MLSGNEERKQTYIFAKVTGERLMLPTRSEAHLPGWYYCVLPEEIRANEKYTLVI